MGNRAFYAVARGKNVGVYNTWLECKKQVDGFSGPRFKKFTTIEEADAFIKLHKDTDTSHKTCTSNSINQRKRVHSSSPNKHEIKRSLLESTNDCAVVYTDGACSSNGKKGAKAGWGVYWGPDHPNNSCGPVDGAATNNRGELLAVIKAIEQAKKDEFKSVVVCTDSQLCINSCDIWINKWEKNGWKTDKGDVKNKELLVQIKELRKTIDVKFEKVKAHCGITGNEEADALARKGAEMYR